MEAISGYGGWRSIRLATMNANTSEIASAPVLTVGGSAVFLSGLSFLGGHQLGTAMNGQILTDSLVEIRLKDSSVPPCMNANLTLLQETRGNSVGAEE